MTQTPNSDTTTEKRRFSRVVFNAEATLTQKESQQSIEVLDISLKGVLVKGCRLENFDLARLLQLRLQLSDNVLITMELRFVRVMNDAAGFESECIDVESIGHLRRLIELNLGDPAAAERDLLELLAE